MREVLYGLVISALLICVTCFGAYALAEYNAGLSPAAQSIASVMLKTDGWEIGYGRLTGYGFVTNSRAKIQVWERGGPVYVNDVPLLTLTWADRRLLAARYQYLRDRLETEAAQKALERAAEPAFRIRVEHVAPPASGMGVDIHPNPKCSESKP